MSENKRYYWLKLKGDFFTSREVKKLRKIAGGDTFTIIYLKMQLISLRDDGYIYYEGTEDNLTQQLSLEIDENEENIKVTLAFLKANNMLEVHGDDIYLNRVPEMIGTETQVAERVRRHRGRTKALQSNAPMLPCNTDVTKRNTDIDIDTDKDKEKEIDKDIYMSPETDLEAENDEEDDECSLKRVPYDKIMNLYNTICVDLPKVTAMTVKRKKAVAARWKDVKGDINAFEAVFVKAQESDWLSGRHGNITWQCNFDWLMKPDRFIQVGEDNYKNRVDPLMSIAMGSPFGGKP